MLEKVYQDRLATLEKIRALGFDPYGGRYDSAEPVAGIRARFEKAEAAQAAQAGAGGGDLALRADAAGRLVLLRPMGKLVFAHLQDQTARMQVAFRRDAIDEKSWELVKCLDLGDLVAAEGALAKTRTGELTIFAERLTLLCKSLLPMPEKFHGLVDTETRYRQRYLDLMSNPEAMAVARQRVAIVEHFRSVLSGRGFVEVETPVLQPVYGGGAARPFLTHHNALDADLYLRISPELYLKRLLVGGMEKVFEIGRIFRNEGLSTRHNPEFTMLELYQAYADYEVMMDITEELIASAAQAVGVPEADRACQAITLGTRAAGARVDAASEAEQQGRKIALSQADTPHPARQAMESAAALRRKARLALAYGPAVIDYSRPWKRVTYEQLLQEHAGVCMRDAAAVRAKARQLRLEESNKDDAVVVNEVFQAAVEPALAKESGPVFVTDYPADLCPLTRRKPDDPTIALRFECYIAGMEIANAYTELNDPAVQEANFRRQLRGEGDAAAMRVLDEDFLTALRQGMPPAGGLGVGIDRVVMLLTNRTSIRDVILFPMLRPEATPR